ncbi:NHLP bacteriocin system secretion protein [Propionivibrio sp.]|uniref:NHLP bacteriocin system secretion protein n=1 Tax=Propionivibrio sp. TaxID=2212460 RepID=UPI003BEFB2FF
MSVRQNIFRQVSLERLSSPEQLDQLVHVITPRGWLLWTPLAGLVIGALLWGFLGSVPTVVSGRAILLQRGGLAEVSSAAQGRVTDLLVGIGSHVNRGQTIVRISQPELTERQRQAIDRLAELHRQEVRINSLLLQGENISDASLKQQQQMYNQQQKAAEERSRLLGERVAAQRILLEQGLITRQSLLATQMDLTNARLESENVRVQVRQLALKQLDTKKQAESQLSQIQSQVAEAQRSVEGLAETERLTTLVESPYAGRVVEVRVSPGALVSPGTPLVMIEPEGEAADGLEVAIYLAASDGKKVTKGMTVHVAPANVRREEYGYLIGEVFYVSDYPATQQSMRSTLQNEELVRELSGSLSPIELRAKLVRADTASGYQWSSKQGPPVKVSAGTPAQAEIVVRRQPPISLLIPALRQALGGL